MHLAELPGEKGMKPRLLDLFSGIGGFSLGLQRAGFEVAGQCELDPFCRAVLTKHWPHVWRHDDVTTLTGDLVREHCGRIDIIAGGFPCQDLSTAGKGAGLNGQRSGLWWQMLRVVREVRPDWLLIENVPALRNRGADQVFDGLGEADYALWPIVVGASAVGAPHKRERIWIVGHARSAAGKWNAGGFSPPKAREFGAGQQNGHLFDGPEHASSGVGNTGGNRRGVREPRRLTEGREVVIGTGEGMANAPSARLEGTKNTRASGDNESEGFRGNESERRGSKLAHGDCYREQQSPRNKREGGGRACDCREDGVGQADAQGLRCEGSESTGSGSAGGCTGEHGYVWPSGPGQEQNPWEAPRLVKFPLGGILDGVPVRLVRFANRNALKAYGNALLPQIPELIGRWLIDSSKPNPPRR